MQRNYTAEGERRPGFFSHAVAARIIEGNGRRPDAGAPLADAAILPRPGDFSLPSQALARFSPCFLMSVDQKVAALEGSGRN
jgi:hypothetical protein